MTRMTDELRAQAAAHRVYANRLQNAADTLDRIHPDAPDGRAGAGARMAAMLGVRPEYLATSGPTSGDALDPPRPTQRAVGFEATTPAGAPPEPAPGATPFVNDAGDLVVRAVDGSIVHVLREDAATSSGPVTPPDAPSPATSPQDSPPERIVLPDLPALPDGCNGEYVHSHGHVDLLHGAEPCPVHDPPEPAPAYGDLCSIKTFHGDPCTFEAGHSGEHSWHVSVASVADPIPPPATAAAQAIAEPDPEPDAQEDPEPDEPPAAGIPMTITERVLGGLDTLATVDEPFVGSGRIATLIGLPGPAVTQRLRSLANDGQVVHNGKGGAHSRYRLASHEPDVERTEAGVPASSTRDLPPAPPKAAKAPATTDPLTGPGGTTDGRITEALTYHGAQGSRALANRLSIPMATVSDALIRLMAAGDVVRRVNPGKDPGGEKYVFEVTP